MSACELSSQHRLTTSFALADGVALAKRKEVYCSAVSALVAPSQKRGETDVMAQLLSQKVDMSVRRVLFGLQRDSQLISYELCRT